MDFEHMTTSNPPRELNECRPWKGTITHLKGELLVFRGGLIPETPNSQACSANSTTKNQQFGGEPPWRVGRYILPKWMVYE